MGVTRRSLGFIASIADVQRLRSGHHLSSDLELDGLSLLRRGVLRHAVKYALWRAHPGSRIKVLVRGDPGLGLPVGKHRQWQVVNEVVKASERLARIEKKTEGSSYSLVLSDVVGWSEPSGVTLAIIWSGSREEVPALSAAVRSAGDALQAAQCRGELLLIGVASAADPCDAASLSNIPYRYVPAPSVDRGGRSLIGIKKNVALECARYDIVSVAHARITYAEDFVTAVAKVPLEVAAPRVTVSYNGRDEPYLDYMLIDHYQLTYRSFKRLVPAGFLGYNYLAALQERVPFIDGGITILDRRAVPERPFVEEVGWGEAEDVEMASRLWQRGYLLDYLPEVRARSRTDKVGMKAGPARRFLRNLRWSAKVVRRDFLKGG